MCGFILLTKLKLIAQAQEAISRSQLSVSPVPLPISYLTRYLREGGQRRGAKSSSYTQANLAGLRRGATVFDNLAAVPKHSRKTRDADTDARAELIRALPPIDECLRAAEALPALAGLSRSYLKVTLQRAQAELRAAILSGRDAHPRDRDAMIDAVVRAAAQAVATDEPVLRPVVNATGVVLHTNLGRAILAESAIEAVGMAARSAVNLKYDLETGA